jgi:hypothetical protein
VAEDLGTWPPEQATVLLDVLQKAGIEAKAKRTRDGVVVTVQDDRADDAHRTLVANMDDIARAARSANPPRSRKKPRKTTDERRGRATPTPSAASRRSGASRLGSLSRPLIILVLGLVLAVLIRSLMVPILVFTLAGVIYTLGKQAQADDDGSG